jgi:hypothetical protein
VVGGDLGEIGGPELVDDRLDVALWLRFSPTSNCLSPLVVPANEARYPPAD